MITQQRLGMGLVGPGFIAAHHLDAVRRLGDVEIVGLAGSSLESTMRRAAALKVPHAFASYEELVRDPRIHVVHNTTPSYLHVPVTLAALEAGKHVISDKPLAMTLADSLLLRDAAATAGVVNAVTFNYRGNPLVQDARARIERGDLGKLTCIQGQYLQDWMTDENVYSWRMDPVKGGVSSALADIGSHWCDLAEHMAGARISRVLADIYTVVTTRYAAAGTSEAFSMSATPGTQTRVAVPIHGEDLATILLRFDNGARGSLRVGQVLPGHKNDLQIELNGRQGSLRWKQERQNELWLGFHDQANQMLAKDPALLTSQAAAYTRLPGGHQEGWADAFYDVIADIYHCIRDRGARPGTMCTFADACRTSRVIDAMLQSASQDSRWIDVLLDT